MSEPKPFRPSQRQRRLAEAACSLAFSVQPRLVCAQAQIPQSTYYRWQKNPAFSAWLAATVIQCLAANSPFLLLNTLQAALTGDASARKLIFQFCIAPRLAPAMAALPAPGLEAFLGIPSDAAMLGPSPIPRPLFQLLSPPTAMHPTSAPPSSGSGTAVSAAKTTAASSRTEPSETPKAADPTQAQTAAPSPPPVPSPLSPPGADGIAAPAVDSQTVLSNSESRVAVPAAESQNIPRDSESGITAPAVDADPAPTHADSGNAAPPANPSPFPPGIAPMWRVNKEGKLEPLPRAYW